ncbi:MAG: four helix bundle protein [Verrucomicrobiaceae bacterium]|nr:MAG: four helix bundle protein [Verrucomicrobiaceae bacterium]
MSDGAEYDLEERTFQFALAIRRCIAGRKWNREQWTDIDQLLRSSGSVAANYVEANNALSKPDFLLRIRISKKEASESRLWLRLLGETSSDEALKQTLRQLYKESDELSRILATILRNSQK